MAKSTLAKLKFSQKLIGSASKPVPIAELIKRLKALHNELASLDQEGIDTESLSTVRKDLIEPTLLVHKDKAVKAYVACCLADLLRLYAPDAPYTLPELRDIFEFLARQLHGIATPNSPHFTEYFYLLESLSTVKSAVLIVDLPNADEVMADLFRDFFDNISSELSKNAQFYMVDILQQLIDECAAVPSDVLEIILVQFLNKRRLDNSAAYQAAVTLCRNTADRLQKYFAQYFIDVIVKDGKSPEDRDSLNKAHELIKELNRVAPALLLNVIPQIEEELKVDNNGMRALATEILGEMFSERSSSLASAHPQTWKSWLQRRNDKVAAIRIACVNVAPQLLKNQADLITDVNELLYYKLQDPDPTVRTQACKVFDTLDYETALHNVDKKTLKELALRCRDKKQAVRTEAFSALGRLYNLAYPEVAVADSAAIKQFSWIPNELCGTLFVNDMEVWALVYNALHEHILPTDSDDVSRTERLLLVYQYLDEKVKKAFLAALTTRHKGNVQWTREFVDSCERYNGGVIDHDADAITAHVKGIAAKFAETFPLPSKAQADLMKFASINDGRLYKLLRESINPQNEYKTIVKYAKEFNKRIEQAYSSIRETFTLLVRRSAFLILNKSTVQALVNKLHDSPTDSNSASTIAGDILRHLSAELPELYKTHVQLLGKIIIEEDSQLVDESLEALANLAASYPGEIASDRVLVERLTNFALSGSPLQAKYATDIIAQTRSIKSQCDVLVERAITGLKFDSANLLPRLATLKELALHAKDAFADMTDALTRFAVKELILKNHDTAVAGNEDWLEDAELPQECRAKMYALKVLTSRLRGDNTNTMAKQIAEPTFKVLWKMLETSGEILADKSTPTSWQSRLRLTAATCILQLAKYPVFDKMVTQQQFQSLALMAQDGCVQVRQAFFSKLTKYLMAGQLHARYWSILFLYAHEPEVSVKQQAKHMVSNYAKSTRVDATKPIFEPLLLRLLHLLAYHPDFSLQVEDLKVFGRFIEYYLDAVATEENVSFLYYLAGRVKTVRDALADNRSGELYTLSDLAMVMIKIKAREASWSIQTYPGTHKHVPADLYAPLRDPIESQEIANKSFLNTEALQAIESMMAPRRRAMMSKKRSSESPAPKAKRVKTSKGKKAIKIKSKAKVRESHDGPRRISDRKRGEVQYYENPESEEDEEEDEEEESESEAEAESELSVAEAINV